MTCYLILIFIFGLCIGSFLNCFIWRLHEKKKVTGRSMCTKCKQQIAWFDNIPVISFLNLRGKCRNCKKSISWQYPAVELVTAILFTLSFFLNYQIQLDNIILIFRDFFLISVMIIIFIYDLRWYLILDIVSLPACAVILILNLVLGYEWQNLLLSGIIGGGFFLIQFVISKGKWIGGGDIRLGLLMGLSLGWPNILVALFIAYILGSVIGVGLIIAKKKQLSSQVPFGVFLSIATIITLFWGREIIDWYLGIIGL